MKANNRESLLSQKLFLGIKYRAATDRLFASSAMAFSLVSA
jgi:hypothetical protein